MTEEIGHASLNSRAAKHMGLQQNKTFADKQLGTLNDMETMLRAIGGVMGVQGPASMASARQWLRGLGENALMSGLGRFALARESVAHPNSIIMNKIFEI